VLEPGHDMFTRGVVANPLATTAQSNGRDAIASIECSS
jgi:hypothetical protein